MARLFWEKLTQQLLEWGFKLNPYNNCVANKVVEGNQLTVVWHVDDLKISHKNKGVVDDFIKTMENEFGNIGPLNISHGKIHDYPGMIFDFTRPGIIVIHMEEYIKKILHDAPPDMKQTAMTPATQQLFKINTNAELLSLEQREIFMHLVMQSLYLSQRGQPDIRTTVSFLCSCLTAPNEDDYNKLCHLIKYLQGMIKIPLTLLLNMNNQIKWWIDASYAMSTHHNMWGHTGATMSMETGSIYSGSWKQKLTMHS